MSISFEDLNVDINKVILPKKDNERTKKIIVYGTFKRGYGNNRLLHKAKFISFVHVEGYKLFYSHGSPHSFPVSSPCEKSTLLGEMFEIDADDSWTMEAMDRLESEGRMYNRIELYPNTFMYVGHPAYWNFDSMTPCPQNNRNIYYWGSETYHGNNQ